MAKETATHIKQMEKTQQKLREILVKDCEEHREQMAQMMQIIMRIAHENGIVDNVGSVNTLLGPKGLLKAS